MTDAAITLFVAWQDPVDRGFFVVGRLLKRQGDGCDTYEFSYVKGVEQAGAHGFRPFVVFPHLDVVYRSDELFPLFANRVMSKNRQDYPAHVEELGLSEAEASPETILARSGGRRATDHVEIFAPLRLNEETGMHEMFFLLRGIRYMPAGVEARIEALAPGDRLYCMLDFQNPKNPRAIALRTEDLCMLGYMPDYLVDDADDLRKAGQSIELFVERVNLPPAPRDHRVLCRLQATWPRDRVPFTGDCFQPRTDAHAASTASASP